MNKSLLIIYFSPIIFFACSNNSRSAGSIEQKLMAHATDSFQRCANYGELTKKLFDSLYSNEWNRIVENDSIDPNSTSIILNHSGGDTSGIVIVQCVVPYYIINNAQRQITIQGRNPGSDGGDYRVDDDSILFPELNGKEPQLSDKHLSIVDTGTKRLYEIYRPVKVNERMWTHEGAAVFDLQTSKPHSTKPNTTSADAAGLPILPGLVRYDELKQGEIRHAFRMTLNMTLIGYTSPATHYTTTGPSNGNWAPMGARFRLRRDFPEEGFSDEKKVIIRCLKKYGAIVADNGTNFAISGTNDCKYKSFKGYDDDTLHGSNSFRLYNENANREIKIGDLELIKLGAIYRPNNN